MMEVFLKENDQVLENFIHKSKDLLLKEIGLMTNDMDMVSIDFKMDLHLLELGIEDILSLELLSGWLELSTMVNFWKGRLKEQGS